MLENLPKELRIREMGPREGLQAESRIVPIEQKIQLIKALLAAGCKYIQVTSFVHPKVVPQFADAEELMKQLEHPMGVFFWATIPNMKGLERAVETGIDGISLPIAVTDGYNIINMQRTTEKAIREAEVLVKKARKANLHVTASASSVFGCPIEGYVAPQRVVDFFKRLEWMGVDAISFGDTTGMANPRQVKALFEVVTEEFRNLEIITHFHNSRGAGLANVLAAIDAGVTIHDCALCGTGGQPATKRKRYAYGKIGNICTEDLVAMLEEMGIDTGIDLEKLIEAAKLFERILEKELYGYVSKAGPVKALWGGGKEYLDYFIKEFGYKDI